MTECLEDDGSIADTVVFFLKSEESLEGGGWHIEGLDIGEIEITTPGGQKFRLTVEEIEE